MKVFRRILILSVISALMFSSAACGKDKKAPSSGDEDIGSTYQEEVNKDKTQLYVGTNNAGYGANWLKKIKDRYEVLHKDDVWEDGKKGVQIVMNPSHPLIRMDENDILPGKDEIYFGEAGLYYHLLNDVDCLGDITEAVTTPIDGDGGKTIEDKLNDQQKAYYKVDGKYYAVPHYHGIAGIIYNVDLFDRQGYYYADSPAGTGDARFTGRNKNALKSAGPDGLYNTFDDGLPRTYDEFFDLCDFIVKHNEIPVCWAGNVYSEYLNYLCRILAADCDGLKQSKLNFTYDGTATTLGRVGDGGEWIPDGNPTVITRENGYELARQEGKYRALQFLERLVRTDKYHNDQAFNSAYNHFMVKDDFLIGGCGFDDTPQCAMLMDGIWWQNEARQTFAELVQKGGEAYSASSRKFGIMPLPKPTAAKVGEKITLYDHLFSICFMKKNIANWKKPLAFDFIKFCNSDLSLKEFTLTTNTPKALNYALSDSDKSQLTYYGRCLADIKEKADIVYPYSQEPVYVNNMTALEDHFFSSKFSYNGKPYDEETAAAMFHEHGNLDISVYFDGLYTKLEEDWRLLK